MDKGSAARERVEAHDPSLNAFVEVLPSEDPQQGPLAGAPVGVKDCFYDRGRTPTMGSNVHPGSSSATAVVLQRLRAAGADIAGYTNLHEWAIGGTSAVTATGPVRNPWDTELVPGGSSGGSGAALAAGLVDLALGTDTGGSIRIPAACCGIVGLKPTQGRVPTAGYVGDGGPTDQIGPMARSVTATKLLLEVLLDERLEDVDPRALRIGIARGSPFDDVQEDVRQPYEDAVVILSKIAPTAEVAIEGWDGHWWSNAALFINDTAKRVADDIRERPERFQPDALKVLRWGLGLPAEVIAEQQRVKQRAKRQWAALFEDIDVLVTPTLPCLPPRIENLTVRLPSDVSDADVAFGRFCGPMNLAGVPCLSLPCGPVGELTVNMSLSAAPGRDDIVLALGTAFEDQTDRAWVDRTAAL